MLRAQPSVPAPSLLLLILDIPHSLVAGKYYCTCCAPVSNTWRNVATTAFNFTVAKNQSQQLLLFDRSQPLCLASGGSVLQLIYCSTHCGCVCRSGVTPQVVRSQWLPGRSPTAPTGPGPQRVGRFDHLDPCALGGPLAHGEIGAMVIKQPRK